MEEKLLKLLEREIEGKFHDIRFGIDFLESIPKAQATKEEINCIHQIKTFHALEDRIIRVRQSIKVSIV